MTCLTLEEILEALKPAWRLANRTAEDGTFLRPDYRAAVDAVWEDLVIAAGMKHDREPQPGSFHYSLNVAMTRLGDSPQEVRP
jgi:hypothetical protein